MKKINAILLLVLVIVTTEGGNQLLKLPLLVSHYQLHIAEGRTRSLGDFLQEHYRQTHHSDNDSNEDEQLPFKAINPEMLFALYAINAPISDIATLAVASNQRHSYIINFTFQDHLAGVFHPPKSQG